MEVLERIRKLAGDIQEVVIGYRRTLHANPELAFEEHKTAAFIAKVLTQLNIPFEKDVAGTGIVAHLEGNNPSSNVIAIRADLDALPIHEKNDVEYKSRNEGVMHACGHDVHMSCVLGATTILNELRDQWEGTVKVIFQPSEEKLPGGASVMIKEGVLNDPKPDAMIGIHVMPELEMGKVGFRPGQYMASGDEIYLTIKGQGGHAALPHQHTNTLLAAARILVALQEIPEAADQETMPTILSFGKMTANGATNVIPDEVQVEGTFRTMNEEWRAAVHDKIKLTAEKAASEMGCTCEVEIKKGYPSLVNDEILTGLYQKAASSYLNGENVVKLDRRMTSDDFAFYALEVPACYFRLGVRNESKGITSSVHTSTFDIDEKALEIGSGLLAWFVASHPRKEI